MPANRTRSSWRHHDTDGAFLMTNAGRSTDPTTITTGVQDPVTGRPFWQISPCPTWCEAAPHQASDNGDDRVHYGLSTRVNLALEDLDRGTYEGVEGETIRWISDEPEYVSLYVEQYYREIEPRIWLGRSESSNGVHLNLTEAKELASELLGIIGYARNVTPLRTAS